MISRQVEQRRTANESVTLPPLTAYALAALQAAGLDFESLAFTAPRTDTASSPRNLKRPAATA
jgi:hypothetical protein